MKKRDLLGLQPGAKTLDETDPLWELVAQFGLNKDCADFRGNSLGLQPHGFEKLLLKQSRLWRKHRHDGHFVGDIPWWQKHRRYEETLASILGCHASIPEATVGNSLSVNSVLLLETFLQYKRDQPRKKYPLPVVVTTATNFPADIASLRRSLHIVFGKDKYHLVEIPPERNGLYDFKKVIGFIKAKPNIILGFFPGLCYITGQRFPIEELTEALHEKDAIAGFDLAHAAGNFRLSLHKWDVDFATLCTYKYLNAGPGAVGGLYVHERWYEVDLANGGGWWSIHEDHRFNPPQGRHVPAPGARRFLASNDPVFNMQGLEAWFDMVDEYGWGTILRKHQKLSDFFLKCLKCVDGMEIITPFEPEQRGCQFSFRTKLDRDFVISELRKRNCFCEPRGADILRAAPVSYNTYMQAWYFCKALETILSENA